MAKFEQHFLISADYAGARVDLAVSALLPDVSRTTIQKWIKSGELTLNGEHVRPKDAVAAGDNIIIHAQIEAAIEDQAEAIALTIVHEDEHVMVINKPAGLVVHPGAGNRTGTLMNALLHHAPTLNLLPRAGIVHRLDKETSGLMVIAKTEAARQGLIRQLKKHEVAREYELVVYGEMISGFTVDAPIGRHPRIRTKMAVIQSELAKEAITHVRVIKRYKGFTHVKAMLETGRTHQIRVHLSYKGYPLVGDSVYGGQVRLPKGATPELITMLRQFPRQALHAKKLSFEHPVTKEHLEFQSELPEDIKALLAVLSRLTQ
ncbi:MAG: 23S rRNA pseudouridine(1911/1915/1917) synthase RluD [Gammaproteobacteria bacterium]|nr:23S rRNA pseudouridine(1911/1915/1917) synthase RluD [Gammaproteobacteria bacterium]